MQQTPMALVVHDLKNALGALEGQLDSLVHQTTEAGARRAHARCVELRQRFVLYLTVYGNDKKLIALCDDESPLDLLERLVHDARAGHADPDRSPPTVLLIEPGNAPPFGFFDPRLVRMALEAALHNALRFARSQIELSVRTQDEGLLFRIDDDGLGLGALDPSEMSTGLGTTLCHAVARAHQHAGKVGRVTLANGPGAGARFELWLP